MKNPYETSVDKSLEKELTILCSFCGDDVNYEIGDNDAILVDSCKCRITQKISPPIKNCVDAS